MVEKINTEIKGSCLEGLLSPGAAVAGGGAEPIPEHETFFRVDGKEDMDLASCLLG